MKTDQNVEKTDQKQINFSLNNRPKTDFLDQKNRLFVKIIRAERDKANPCRAASFAKVRLGPCNSSFLIKGEVFLDQSVTKQTPAEQLALLRFD